MPDAPDPDRRKHPVRRGKSLRRGGIGRGLRDGYVELRCKTNFSFLRGAAHPEELVERAVALGHPGLGVADVNTLAGVVRAHCAAKEAGLKLLVGAEAHPVDGPPIGLFAMNRRGYGGLCRLLTAGNRRAKKGECRLTLADICGHSQDVIAIVHESAAAPEDCRAAFGDRLYLGVELHRGAGDDRRLAELAEASRRSGVPLVAVNDVHYPEAARRFLQDVLVCIREKCRLTEAGHKLFPNGERCLKSAEDMHRLFAACPAAVARTLEIADRCSFSLEELRYEYPPEVCPEDCTPAQRLAELTWAGARRHYGGKIPAKVRRLVEHELALIGELAYEHYFLTVWDLVRFARGQGILCQGRGSAANSAVCFCLGITAVDPARIDVLFERFVSAERNEPPDIDVDFEHERREEVIQYIYGKYGRERAGIAAEVITYRPRSAVRDVGKALGLSLDKLDAIARKVEWWSDPQQIAAHLAALGLDPDDYTMRCLVGLCRQIIGFPRHLSQHVGGFVMTAGPLCELVPIGNAGMPERTFIEWDKDDIDALGILKVDCLALGMLTAIRKCLGLLQGLGAAGVAEAGGTALSKAPPRDPLPAHPLNPSIPQSLNPSIPPSISHIPAEDPAVYAMICRADTVGVFQVESRAQMSMLPRLRPRCFYDLVIEVAIVRPGPIQGGMIHPYLRRRSGQEEVTYPSEAVRDVLHKTLGVPLFQEQAMKLAIVAAGFTPGDADKLRRSMAAWRRSGAIDTFREKLIGGMRANGYAPEFAEQLFNQIRGFGEYGFPESHAASFALLVYVSAWLKRYHPAAFAAALINSQPMGFYAPAQLVRDAREHGVEVRAVDVNGSAYDCTLERQGLRDSANKGLRDSGIEGLSGEEAADAAESKKRSAARRSLNPLIPQSLNPSSQSLNPSIPQSLDSSIPHSLPSQWGQGGPALRLGFRLIKGLSQAGAEAIVRAREQGGLYRSIADVARRSGASRALLARLAAADAFRSLGLDRRDALWQVLALEEELPLFAGLDADEPDAPLPRMDLAQHVVRDYESLGLSLKAHPMELIRPHLASARVQPASDVNRAPQGRRVNAAGLVLVRQRPSTALGIVFMTIEDETGVVNLVVRPKVYERFRAAASTATALVAQGRIERVGEVVHLQVERLTSINAWMEPPQVRARNFH